MSFMSVSLKYEILILDLQRHSYMYKYAVYWKKTNKNKYKGTVSLKKPSW